MQELIPNPFYNNNYCVSSTSEEMGMDGWIQRCCFCTLQSREQWAAQIAIFNVTNSWSPDTQEGNSRWKKRRRNYQPFWSHLTVLLLFRVEGNRFTARLHLRTAVWAHHVFLSGLVTAISTQSCWPPTRRKTLTWHFHSQIICFLLKIYALGFNRNGPEPEHLALPLQSSDVQSGLGFSPAVDTATLIFSSGPSVGLVQWTFWICQHSQLHSETSELAWKCPAWVHASILCL